MPMLKTFLKSFIIFLFLSSVHVQILHSQTLNYAEIFGDDWKKAEAYERENRHWMETILRRNNISYHVAIAVIFPELVRYSALRDKMEITLLKALYVNLGEEYANFSIGQFQIKPSFASLIIDEAKEFPEKSSGLSFKGPEGFDDIKNYRKSIIVDLEDPKTQFNYVVAFMKICEKKYKTGRMDEESRVRFLSTAFNRGIDKSYDDIEKMTDDKFFHTRLIKTEIWCYSDVSLYWYRHSQWTAILK